MLLKSGVPGVDCPIEDPDMSATEGATLLATVVIGVVTVVVVVVVVAIV